MTPARTYVFVVLAALLQAACGTTDSEAGDAQPSLPALHVQGNRIVDARGNVVTLRGVSFSDPDRLERAGQWSRPYFEAAASWNANVVRFPIHPDAWRSRGADAYLSLLDRGIAIARTLDLYVILDWHSIGNLKDGRYQNASYNTTWAETIDFWTRIARRYADEPVVAGYELFNEPTDGGGRFGVLSWADHRAMMEDLIDEIRAIDDQTIVLVGGIDWAYLLDDVVADPVQRPGVAYVSHPYPMKRTPPWEAKWEADFGHVAATYPIVATEFGFMSEGEPGAHVPVIGDETYGTAIVDFFEERGISWTAWVFDPTWSPQLITGWDYEPTRQGIFFRTALMALNPRHRD